MTDKNSKYFLWGAVIAAIFFFVIFFRDYFFNIEKFILSYIELSDWEEELIFYSNIKYQLFNLGQVPYYHPYLINMSNALFSNPQTAVLSPVNLLLPFVSIYNFFIFHLSYHYLIAIFGLVLLRRYFKLPFLAILPAFFLLGFNGRILSKYYVGHNMFITFLYFPLVLYLYFCLIKQRKLTIKYSALLAFVMTLVFFEGGIYFFIWLTLFFFFDMAIVAISILREKRKYVLQPLARYTDIFFPIRNITLTFAFFVLFSSIKLLPVLASFGEYNPSLTRLEGYRNILFFLQTFYQPGLGSSIPFKELWLQEAYNFIGIEASILAVLSFFYFLFLAKVTILKRLAIAGIIFCILSFGDIYYKLFGFFPFLQGARVHNRFVFMTIGILALLIPLSINHVLLRLKASIKIREIVMLILGVGVFLRLYSESKKWMVKTEGQFVPNILLSDRNGGGIEKYFYIGLIISGLSMIGVLAIHIFQKRKSLN